jgi:hypothetical protein
MQGINTPDLGVLKVDLSGHKLFGKITAPSHRWTGPAPYFVAVSANPFHVAFGACCFPARRAMDLDSVQSLRNI